MAQATRLIPKQVTANSIAAKSASAFVKRKNEMTDVRVMTLYNTEARTESSVAIATTEISIKYGKNRFLEVVTKRTKKIVLRTLKKR